MKVTLLAFALSLFLIVARLYVPTDPVLSWVESFKAFAHITMGFGLCYLLLVRRGWAFGWWAVGIPAILELVLFVGEGAL